SSSGLALGDELGLDLGSARRGGLCLGDSCGGGLALRGELGLDLGSARRGGLAERLVDPLLEQAAEHAQRVELEREQRAVLAGLDLTTYELPLIGAGLDLAGLYRLSKELRAHLAGTHPSGADPSGAGPSAADAAAARLSGIQQSGGTS
ncbi:MAG TPA: hypothetical protein VFH94_25560, partial [Streptomyces sp.]|nr:hypothetical protein [Streptomyces sp.]